MDDSPCEALKFMSQFNWTGQISIQQVLAEIRANPQRTFWLAFVRGTGKDRGSVKVVAKASYGAPMRTQSGQALLPKSDRKRALHIEKGTLPMSDEMNTYLTPLISHIIGYNLMKVVH